MDIGHGDCSSSNDDDVAAARRNGEKRMLAGRGVDLMRGGRYRAVGRGPDDVGDRSGSGQLVDAFVDGDVMQFQDVAVCTGDEGVGWADDGQGTRYGRRGCVLHDENGGDGGRAGVCIYKKV